MCDLRVRTPDGRQDERIREEALSAKPVGFANVVVCGRVERVVQGAEDKSVWPDCKAKRDASEEQNTEAHSLMLETPATPTSEHYFDITIRFAKCTHQPPGQPSDRVSNHLHNIRTPSSTSPEAQSAAHLCRNDQHPLVF